LSRWLKKRLNFSGYFQIYQLPVKHLHLFDTCEKRDLFQPGGLNEGTNIADYLVEKKVPHFFADWSQAEPERVAKMREIVSRGEVSVAFMYTADMDALLHMNSRDSQVVRDKIQWYREKIREIYETAKATYDEVDICVFSDHGMAPITRTYDVLADIEKTGLKFAEDYIAMYDSTIARFWFFKDGAREKITAALEKMDCGRILPDEELESLGCLWPDRRFGELMFLLDAGVLMIPSFMGNKPIAGMHGYHPDDKDSYASFISSRVWSPEPECITDIYRLMKSAADDYLAAQK